LYRGTQLAKNGDVVVVTINYRLGPFGFLYFEKTGAANHGLENNLGIRDQIAALQWVKENIAAFGGDPAQVTIFGESAGGTSVETLLATPSAKGLFKGAIAESGPPAIVWQPAVAQGITNKYCALLNISPDSIYLLKTMPLDTLKAAEDKLLEYMVAETNEKVFAPSVDGQVLTNDIFKCMKPDPSNEVALMIGTNHDEITMFASKKLKMAPRDAKGLDKYFDEVAKESKPKVLAGYENYPRRSAVMDILTDAVFRIPAIRLAECRSMYSPVYMYRFEWSSFLLNLAGYKSFHGLEIPFVFGNTDGKVGKLLRVLATKKLITRLSGEMQQRWINFARYGNPNGKETETWKKYDLSERATMIFDKKTRVSNDPDGKQRAAWDGVSYY
jgi:para-nitrobenzyl esterase